VRVKTLLPVRTAQVFNAGVAAKRSGTDSMPHAIERNTNRASEYVNSLR